MKKQNYQYLNGNNGQLRRVQLTSKQAIAISRQMHRIMRFKQGNKKIARDEYGLVKNIYVAESTQGLANRPYV